MSCADLIETLIKCQNTTFLPQTHTLCLWITVLISFIQSLFPLRELCLIFCFSFVFVILLKIHKHSQCCTEKKKSPCLFFFSVAPSLAAVLALPHTGFPLISFLFRRAKTERKGEEKNRAIDLSCILYQFCPV